MTIEEYEIILQAEMGISDTAIKKIGNSDEKATRFYEGQIEGLRIALDLLKKLEHDVTLKEIKEMCQSYIGIGGCMKCPLNKNSYAYNCIAVGMPSRLDIASIQKCMKEERK